MKTLLLFCLLLLGYAVESAPIIQPKRLANLGGIVTSMSSTDLVAIEINGVPKGIANTNLLAGLASTGYVTALITNGLYRNQYTTNAYNSVGVPDSLWFDGTVGATPTAGAGTRLMWIPAKKAIRAGTVTGTQWDAANIGTASASFGQDNIGSGQFSYVAGSNNKVDANNAIIGCGDQNTNSALYGVIAGGARNWIKTGSSESVISGGNVNTIEANVLTAVIAGGDTQTIRAGSDSSFLGGGIRNEINTNAPESIIIGGQDNFVGRNADLSFIAGGKDNKTATNSTTILGQAITNNTKFSIEFGFYDTNKVRVDQTNLHLIGSERLRQTNGAANGYVLTSTNGGDGIWLPAPTNGFASSGFAALEVQTNGVRVGLGTNVNFIGATGQLSGATIIIGGFSGGGSSVTGTTNILNLSVQAAKLPTTNYPGIDAGWQDWELIYYKTNAEGSIASLSGTWQFIVPPDYATNTMKVRIYSLLLSTNGPNSSNTIFRASVLRVTPSDSTDLHTASFGSTVSGTTTWAASFNGTNKVQSVVINMSTTSALAAGDLCILKVDRDASTDTHGGPTSMVGLQLEYVRQ